MADESHYGANTIFKTTLAVHDEKLRAQKEQGQQLLASIQRFHSLVIKDLENLRKDINEKDINNFRYINDKIDEAEERMNEKYENISKTIKEFEYRVQGAIENSNKTTDEKFRSYNDFIAKVQTLPSKVNELVKKVESLEHSKWYIMGLGGALSAYVTYRSLF